jgi:hypothetical protein
MGTKAWYMSKTIWVNVLALIGSLLVAFNFDPGRWAEISATVLAVANIILRFLTDEPIDLPLVKTADKAE